MFQAGEQIGPYVLVKKLGKGGFGVVWLAEKRSRFLSKKVAIKLLDREQIDFVTVRREAVLWEEASGHPNVLPIIDAEAYGDQVVIVSEYADGGSLANKLKAEGKLTVREAVDLTIGILKGLEYLHGKKIIHRDIKPQNILLQGNTPRLADFGISRAMQTISVSSTVVGTDAYMSPEAFDGKRSVQTDIWSVGVVLYQLLNGSLPFPQEHPSERMFAVLTKDFAPLTDNIPAEVKKILETALAKLPENRFQSAHAMRKVLEGILGGIDHPTLAETQVYGASGLKETGQAGPDEQETRAALLKNAPKTSGPENSVVTEYAAGGPEAVDPPMIDDQIPPTVATGHGSGPGPSPSGVMCGITPGVIVGFGLIALFLLTLVVLVGVAVSKRFGAFATPTPTPYHSTPYTTYTPYGTPQGNNRSNTPSHTPTPTRSPSAPANTLFGNFFPSVTPTPSPSRSPKRDSSAFCRGYVDGWNDGWNSIKGMKLPRVEVQCPDVKPYADQSYEGGRIAGLQDGMKQARGID